MRGRDSSGELRVAVFDMQPIDPPIGGGRVRLLGLYHALGPRLATTYLGAYDWPGPTYREQKLGPSLMEIVIPLSAAHFSAAERWRGLAGGRTIIDSTFPLMAHLSPQYVERARELAEAADIVVVSHPWVYPLVRDELDASRQLLVHDSHNFEGLLRAELLDDGDFGTEVVKGVVATEFELAQRADLLVVCSDEDRDLFSEVYGIDSEKIRVVPNGVFSEKLVPPNSEAKKSAKSKLDLPGTTAIFIGSGYAPNVEAVKFLCEEVAPLLPEVTFAVCGGVADSLDLEEVRYRAGANVRFIGVLSEAEKLTYLWASDMAVNPMFSGSGTNIKMLDFMAAGLAVASTPVGARGIEPEFNGKSAMVVAGADDIAASLRGLAGDGTYRQELGITGRRLVEERFSWEKISPGLGRLLVERHDAKGELDGARFEQTLVSDKGREACIVERIEGSRTERSSRAPRPIRIAVLTTWGIRCGIAENSKHLFEALGHQGVECLILANSEHGQGELSPGSVIDVKHVWDYGSADPQRIAIACREASIDRLNIQYQPSFFDAATLANVVEFCAETGLEVSVALHNSVDVDETSLSRVVASGATIIVHNEAERMAFTRRGAESVYHLPLGVFDLPARRLRGGSDRDRTAGFPVIGSFGFLRPHKGMLELIEAIDLLRDPYPNVSLLGMNALYPSEDSKDYLATCLARVAELGLEGRVQINSDFLEISEVIGHLAATDLIVLPYHHSNESASASVNVAAAAKRPIIATRQRIFEAHEGFLHKVESPRPAVLAAGMALLLANPPLMKQLERNCRSYVQMNNWQAVAKKFLKALFTSEKRNRPAETAGPDYEGKLQHLYESILRDGDIAIDAGAHVGRHTFPIAKSVFPHGKVYAFEPLPMCRDTLQHKMNSEYPEIGSIIELQPYALSDYEGVSEFVVAVDSPGYSGLKEREYDTKTNLERIQVSVETIDNLCGDLPSLAYIKIDVEGGEFHIMKGAHSLINKHRPLISFEFGLKTIKHYEITPRDAYKYLESIDYLLFDILGNEIESAEQFGESATVQAVWDYLAVPKENRALEQRVRKALQSQAMQRLA